MSKLNYTVIHSDFQTEVQAHKNGQSRWSDGKYKPTAKAEAKLLRPSKRMLAAQATRQATMDEFFN